MRTTTRMGTAARRRAERGVTFIEVIATMVVLVIGLLGAGLMVSTTAKQNRRTLTQTHALLIAEQELERIRSIGCDEAANSCVNVQGMGRTFQMWQTAEGDVLDVAPTTPGLVARQYDVVVDVDPPFEGSETGAPLLNRIERGVTIPANRIANVRVTVSWRDPGDTQAHSVALQTRLVP